MCIFTIASNIESRKFQRKELVEILRRSTKHEFKSLCVDLIAQIKTLLQFEGSDEEFNKNTRNKDNFSRFTFDHYKRWQKSSRILEKILEDNDEWLNNEMTFFIQMLQTAFIELTSSTKRSSENEF